VVHLRTSSNQRRTHGVGRLHLRPPTEAGHAPGHREVGTGGSSQNSARGGTAASKKVAGGGKPSEAWGDGRIQGKGDDALFFQ
jgi:hypothetical protein